MPQPPSALRARSLRPRSKRSLAALAVVTVVATAVIAPSTATAAVDTPFTFDQPAAGTSGTVQYLASGATPTTLTGTGPDGATVRIETVDSGTLTFDYPCVTTVVNGAWSCDVTFGSFVGTVSAQRMEDSGGVSLPAEQVARTVVALTPPVFDAASTAVVSSSTSATITGTVGPLLGTTTATVRLTVEGDEICTTAVAAAGTWSCSASFAGALDGVLDLAVTQTRSAGGASGTSLAATTTYTLDTTGPVTPATFTTPSGSSLTASQATFSLAGTADALATVIVRAGSTTLCGPLVADASGTWSCTATSPTDGSYTMTIAQADALGNVGTAPSESIALTVTRSNVIELPSINISPPPVFVPFPNIFIAPPPAPIVIEPFAGQVIEISNGLASESEARTILRDIIVTDLQSVFQNTSVDFRRSTRIPDVTMLLSIARMFPDVFSDVEVVDPTTGEIGPRSANWDDLPWRAQVVFFLGPDTGLSGESSAPLPELPSAETSSVLASRSSFMSARDQTTVTSPILDEGEILLDQQDLTGEGEVTLSGTLPADLVAGEYAIGVRVVLVPDAGVDVPQDVEPIEVTIPITVVADEPASTPGISPWLWAGLAALLAGIIAIVVVMARNARRRA